MEIEDSNQRRQSQHEHEHDHDHDHDHDDQLKILHAPQQVHPKIAGIELAIDRGQYFRDNGQMLPRYDYQSFEPRHLPKFNKAKENVEAQIKSIKTYSIALANKLQADKYDIKETEVVYLKYTSAVQFIYSESRYMNAVLDIASWNKEPNQQTNELMLMKSVEVEFQWLRRNLVELVKRINQFGDIRSEMISRISGEGKKEGNAWSFQTLKAEGLERKPTLLGRFGNAIKWGI